MAAVLSFNDSAVVSDVASLADVTKGQSACVISVGLGSGGAEVQRRLNELGFLPGETIRVVARGVFGGDPIAVRVGTATFALRRFEAECIRVSLTPR